MSPVFVTSLAGGRDNDSVRLTSKPPRRRSQLDTSSHEITCSLRFLIGSPQLPTDKVINQRKEIPDLTYDRLDRRFSRPNEVREFHRQFFQDGLL